MTLLVAFLAGLVSCISPCVLPVVPVYAGYVAGGAGTGWTGGSGTSAELTPRPGSATWRAVGFLIGFLGMFVAIWASVGLIGYGLMTSVPLLRQLTGAGLVAMGIALIAGRHPMLQLPAWMQRVGRGGPVLLGAGVAVGWTPCIGPTLGAILALAASSATVGAGFVLLVAYAIGLAVPFVMVLVALRRFRNLVAWLASRRRVLDALTGVLVMGVGILVYTGAFARLAGLFNIGVV